MSIPMRMREWLDERFGWDALTRPLKHKTVPIHNLSYWYFFGGITLFLFAIQVATGMLLLLYYRPTPSEAFESVQYVMTQVQFGWLVRSIHAWAANLMVLTAFLHMFSVLFLKSYRKPRELTWVSGVLLFFLLLAFGFSGYLLPWNTLSFFATNVGTQIAGQIPLIGTSILRFLRGGEQVSGATLTRFFGFHVALLPGITTLLILFHLALVQRLGLSIPPSVEKKWAREAPVTRERPFFPNFVLRELMAWYIGLGVLGALAAFAPWQLGVKADPFAAAPQGIKPEWYFLFMFQALKILPAKILSFDGDVVGVMLFGVAALIWLLLPFATAEERPRRLQLITGIGAFAAVYITAMTIYAYVSK